MFTGGITGVKAWIESNTDSPANVTGVTYNGLPFKCPVIGGKYGIAVCKSFGYWHGINSMPESLRLATAFSCPFISPAVLFQSVTSPTLKCSTYAFTVIGASACANITRASLMCRYDNLPDENQDYYPGTVAMPKYDYNVQKIVIKQNPIIETYKPSIADDFCPSAYQWTSPSQSIILVISRSQAICVDESNSTSDMAIKALVLANSLVYYDINRSEGNDYPIQEMVDGVAGMYFNVTNPNNSPNECAVQGGTVMCFYRLNGEQMLTYLANQY